jgi:hypothetical protein
MASFAFFRYPTFFVFTQENKHINKKHRTGKRIEAGFDIVSGFNRLFVLIMGTKIVAHKNHINDGFVGSI